MGIKNAATVHGTLRVSKRPANTRQSPAGRVVGVLNWEDYLSRPQRISAPAALTNYSQRGENAPVAERSAQNKTRPDWVYAFPGSTLIR